MPLARLTLLGLAPATLAIAAWLTGCGGDASKLPAEGVESSHGNSTDIAAGSGTTTSSSAKTPKAPLPAADPIVVLRTTAGDIKLKLFAEKAPQTVENFLSTYASRGFYEETIFHHVEPASMLIGGGYTAELEPKPVRTPIYNESRNGLTNRPGTVAMIRDPDLPHSATSQFFINLAENADLDFKASDNEDVLGYCVFGEVVEGMDVVQRIAQLPTTAQGEFEKIPSPIVAIRSVERLR
jgi:peptidyl-prolyl cis-trans isomerase B (cyclophilin B)